MSNEKQICELYKSGLSIRDVIKKVDTNLYPSLIYKILKSNNIEIRTKSQVQKAALASGKVKHPTEGMVRQEKTKLKISRTLQKYWDDMTDEDKQFFSELSKKRWDEKSEEERDQFHKSGIKAIRQAAESGSKMEFFVVQGLTKAGYSAIHHKKKMLANLNLEVDIFIPSLNIVIEVDGPSHQLPIWGDEAFKKRQKLDADKNGLLLSKGYVIIRFKFNDNKLSLYNKTMAMNKIIEIVQSVEKNFPDKDNRFYEVKI